MDLILGFGLFLGGVVVCMVQGMSLAWALLLGFICFYLVGLHRGFRAGELARMAMEGGKTAFVVLRILVLIGVLTGLWRAGGTIAYFVAMGLRLITPNSFVLIAFLLPAVLCLAFGSSFGVSGTAGVILMTIARSGGADPVVAAGAALSGAYFGERLSPASSAAALVAAVSRAEQRTFQRQMWKDTMLPLALTLGIYTLLSRIYPIQRVDPQILQALEGGFTLNWLTVLPAIALLVLPWFKLKAIHAIAISCVLAAVSAVAAQGMGLGEVLRVCVLGYEEQHPLLAGIMSGGGLVSMAGSVCIVFLSCAYAGIFNGTGILDPLKEKAGALAERIGRIPAQCVVGLCTGGLFCNQTVAIVMNRQIMERYYREHSLSGQDMARDVGNTVLNLVGMIPWAIACSVPLTNMGSNFTSIPFAVFLYLVPLCAWLTRNGGKRKKGCNPGA